jgi:hypothetical protein
VAGILFGIKATDPNTYLMAALLMTAISISAAYIPASWVYIAMSAENQRLDFNQAGFNMLPFMCGDPTRCHMRL